MVKLSVNGMKHNIDVEMDARLLDVIREDLNLKGTKNGCGIAECGCCTVLVDGEKTLSCQITVEDVLDSEITTIEGLGKNHPVKKAWIQEQVPQCGYCQPGQMMAAAALLDENSDPSQSEIVEGMDSVLCRCGAYQRIVKGVRTASKMMND